MLVGEAFDLYSNINAEGPASRRKVSRRHPVESSSDPSKKRARTEYPPTPPPSKDTTPPLAPLNPTPPAPLDPTPSAPRNPSPPAQSGKTQAEAILNTAYNSANNKLKKLSRHRRSNGSLQQCLLHED
ncbi:sulfated surface glycoprotein 185-like [Humulus lupulus]|uniref:sulfated surface glycoprotein 185-like n=1 Tax=Humulus lupulus TaxID=3486 RepID=UPI002B40B447|nr:sulfated surface glycoprotein 185-like [Humulus lupulus]